VVRFIKDSKKKISHRSGKPYATEIDFPSYCSNEIMTEQILRTGEAARNRRLKHRNAEISRKNFETPEVSEIIYTSLLTEQLYFIP
jgi:hypothetical protein